MTSYLNEEEQVEELKKWWKENGKSVVIGIVLGFSAIFGWQGWQSYRIAQGEAASTLYTYMQNLTASGKVELALDTGKRLLGEHTDSIYASFAALKLAQLMNERGDLDNAAENLQWVVSHAPDALIADLARVRLAHIRFDQKQLDDANALLAQVDVAFMPAGVAELRGDIARAKGDLESARQAYQAALLAGDDTQGSIRMKLRDIGAGEKSS